MTVMRRASQAGFTLIEVMVALGILSFVILTFLDTRTDAIVDASEARNWRLARDIAQEVLSELQAGARELPPDATRVPLEEPQGFSYQILVGDAAISSHESDEASSWDLDAGGDRGDRLAWQRERDDMRLARQKGLSLFDYREQQLQDELDLDDENDVPNEDDLEEVMVVVFFPDVRIRQDNTGESSFRLRAKVSTLAIEGLTPEEADDLARARGLDPANSTPAEDPQ